jgi:glucokinase
VPLDAEPAPDLPRVASAQAKAGACAHCIEAMDLFVEAYGAEAGNLALRTVATRGVYVGGGIAPKNLELLCRPAFVDRFNDKPPMEGLLRTVPIRVILNPHAGLLGAATVANAM